MKIKKRRLLRNFLLLLLIGLIIFRLFLPSIVKNYVNKVLADLPGYHGSVTDIDIALYRGAYVIEGLKLHNNNAVSDVPFIDFPKIDISVEWKALFKGRIVSELYLYDPTLIYVIQDMEVDNSEGDDWTEALTDLVPIEINHFAIEGGKIAYVDTEADPYIDVSVRNFALTADNLRNVIQEENKLPSPITGTGIAVGNGNLTIDGKLNLIKQVPDADLNIKLETTDLTAFNEVSSKTAGIDFESGEVNAYSELAIADGFITGYFKVLFSDTKFNSKEDGLLEKIWEGFVSFFEFVLKNKKTNNFAIKAPIEGQIESYSVKTWPTIGSIFKNAFIQAFKSDIDNDVEYQDALLQEELDTLGFFQFKKKREVKKKIKAIEKKAEAEAKDDKDDQKEEKKNKKE